MLVVVGLRPTEPHCDNERPLSFVTRSWCDVQAAVFNAKLAQRASRGTGAHALTVTKDEAQHSSLLRAHAMQRWLWTVCDLQKGTAPARGLSRTLRACGVTYQLPPPTPNQRHVAMLRRHSGARCH